LNNYVVPHAASLRRIDSGDKPVATPALGSGPGGSYRGNDFRGAYLRGVSTNVLGGTGQMVGLLEFDTFYPNDITTYETQCGLPNVPIETVLADGFDGQPGQANVEVALDIEMAISMAPYMQLLIVYASPMNGIANDVLSRMANDNLAKQL